MSENKNTRFKRVVTWNKAFFELTSNALLKVNQFNWGFTCAVLT